MSTHNICFCGEIRKIVTKLCLLSITTIQAILLNCHVMFQIPEEALAVLVLFADLDFSALLHCQPLIRQYCNSDYVWTKYCPPGGHLTPVISAYKQHHPDLW